MAHIQILLERVPRLGGFLWLAFVRLAIRCRDELRPTLWPAASTAAHLKSALLLWTYQKPTRKRVPRRGVWLRCDSLSLVPGQLFPTLDRDVYVCRRQFYTETLAAELLCGEQRCAAAEERVMNIAR